MDRKIEIKILIITYGPRPQVVVFMQMNVKSISAGAGLLRLVEWHGLLDMLPTKGAISSTSQIGVAMPAQHMATAYKYKVGVPLKADLAH